MYYISKLSIITNDNRKSEIELNKGLNIIYGKSNTGKSLVVDCINYMFGARNHRFSQLLNIRDIQLFVETDRGKVELTRKVGTNNIYVSGSDDRIISGKYGIGSSKNSISKVWLNLLGIEEETKIISNLEGKIQKLTYRSFCHIFLIDEEEVIKTQSIFTPKGSRGNVNASVLSALIYLATANNYLTEDNIKGKEIRKERKDAVKSFVDRSLEKIRNKNYEDFVVKIDKAPSEIQNEINLLLAEIENTEEQLDININQRTEIVDKIVELEDIINQNNVLYSRNSNLASQYISDIKRLTFIAESDFHMEDVPALDHCPFCNGELPKDKSESCIEAAFNETEKIKKQLEDLESMQKSLLTEVEEFSVARKDLMIKKKEIDRRIRNEIKPKISELRKQLQDYTISLNQAKAKEMVNSFNKLIIEELRITEEEESKEIRIEIPKIFEEKFKDRIVKNLDKLLVECNYSNYNTCDFIIPGYDVVINGQPKGSQGKGFRAYLNTLLAIAVQDCLYEYNLYIPSIFVVDSPILTLKEKEIHQREVEGELVSNPMKEGLFKYLVNHQENKQIIVIENEIPDIDYKGVNLIQFTKDETVGRYGLLENFRD